MEEAFSLLYVSKDFPGIYGKRRGRRPRTGSRREISDFLRITFGMLAALDKETVENNLYDNLAAAIGPEDTIITLNYDTTLDSALVRVGWNPVRGYGLMGGTRKVKWNIGGANVTPKLANVRLLKLHGSVNWFVRGSYARVQHVFERKPVLITRPRRNERKGHIRQIVPPIFGKFFGHAHWGHLWSQAFNALCVADAVIVIGCSLIETDFHLRALIQRAATVRKENGSRFHCGIFVDKALVRRRWQKAFKGAISATEGISNFKEFSKQHLRSTTNAQE
jgi:hypothetical protein